MLAAARGTSRPEYALLREALGEVMRASAQARRVGVNLNQVVAALNSTGELPPTLIFFADAAYRTVRNLDELAEQLRARLP